MVRFPLEISNDLFKDEHEVPIESLVQRLDTNLHTGLSDHEAAVSDRDARGISRDAVQRRLATSGRNSVLTRLTHRKLEYLHFVLWNGHGERAATRERRHASRSQVAREHCC